MDQLNIENFGIAIKDAIIFGAEFLTLSDSRPGLIAVFLALCLVIFAASYFIRTSRQLRAILALDARVREFKTIDDFASGYSDFQNSLKETYRANGPREAVWEAWDEFNETVVPDDIDGPLRMRNSIRPASFLNVEDLGFGPGSYRILPNTFVSVGLFLTFPGLVAALDQFSQSMNTSATNSMNDAMQDFMQIASAKFVMSGPVTYLCRPQCSFRPLGVRRPRGFYLPMLNADGASYRSR